MDKAERHKIVSIWEDMRKNRVEEYVRATEFYVSPGNRLDNDTYCQALKDAMIAAELWPDMIATKMDAAAEEYEEIMLGQEIFDGI